MPKTIDHCFVDCDEPKLELRRKFRLGVLGHGCADPDVIDPKLVEAHIAKAKAREPTGSKDLCIKKLPDAIKESYDLSLGELKPRVDQVVADIKTHLYKYKCEEIWEIPPSGRPDPNKFKRREMIKAMINVLRPTDFRDYIEMRVSQESNLSYDHHKVISEILKVGDVWDIVYKQKAAVSLSKKLNRGKTSISEDVSAMSSNVNTGKVKTYKRARCIGCGAKDHYFLRKVKGQYMQNCPKDVGVKFDELKRESLASIDAAKEKDDKRKQKRVARKAEAARKAGTTATAKAYSARKREPGERGTEPPDQMSKLIRAMNVIRRQVEEIKNASGKSAKTQAEPVNWADWCDEESD